jgi:hypothetical protein
MISIGLGIRILISHSPEKDSKHLLSSLGFVESATESEFLDFHSSAMLH